jgi:hypothetical protein
MHELGTYKTTGEVLRQRKQLGRVFSMRIDWLFALMLMSCCILWCLAGFTLCWGTHRQRGIEVDRPITDNLPLPPAPIVVPDHVPDEWIVEERLRG